MVNYSHTLTDPASDRKIPSDLVSTDVDDSALVTSAADAMVRIMNSRSPVDSELVMDRGMEGEFLSLEFYKYS